VNQAATGERRLAVLVGLALFAAYLLLVMLALTLLQMGQDVPGRYLSAWRR